MTRLARIRAKVRRYAAAFRVPDYKTPGSNLEATRGELGLAGRGFAGKWFSRDQQASDGYHAPGKFQLHIDADRLGDTTGDVIDHRERELGVGSRTPMYLHRFCNALATCNDLAPPRAGLQRNSGNQ